MKWERRRGQSAVTRLSVSLWALFLVAGCEAPTDAPTDYESMLGYIFAHADDVAEEGEQPAELVAGLENLHDWLQESQNLEAAMKGYTINSLDEVAVDALDEVDRSAANLNGISVVTKSPHEIPDIVGLLTWTRFKEVLFGRADANFERYERTFDSEDPSCFGRQECDQVKADSDTKSFWGGFIGMETKFRIEFRWVETKYGWMVVHRFWLKEPADGDCCDVVMHNNYYVGVMMLDGGREGASLSTAAIRGAGGLVGNADERLKTLETLLKTPGALRVHANWFDVDYGVFPISKEQALETIVNSTKNDSNFIDGYLTENPEVEFGP